MARQLQWVECVHIVKVVIFLADTFIFWISINLFEGMLNGPLVLLSKYGVIYICFILSLYAFSSYNSIHLLNLGDSVLGTGQGLFVGGVIASALVSSSFISLSAYHIFLLAILLWIDFSIVRFIAWTYIRKQVVPMEVIVVGTKFQWEATLNVFSLVDGKLLPVSYCEPSLESISRCLNQYPKVSVILVADSRFLTDSFVRKRLSFLRQKNIKIEFLPTFIEKNFRKVSIAAAKEFSSYYEVALYVSSQARSHRIFDIIMSIVGLVIGLPLMAIIALCIVIDSGFPIIFRQERIGLNGKVFVLHKFRTMINGEPGPAFANEEAHRITRLGGVLRAIHLDELPQLWDVFRGHMNLVGPRPEQLVFVENFSDEIAFYNYRHKVKPGITGWAQVNLPYASSTEETRKKLEYDLYYVKNRTFLFDIKIMLKTIETIFNLREVKGMKKDLTEKPSIK